MPKPLDSITTLLFDWDGTLVDSAHLGLAAYEKAFAELDFVFSKAAYEANYSPNWYTFTKRSACRKKNGNERTSYGDNTMAIKSPN